MLGVQECTHRVPQLWLKHGQPEAAWILWDSLIIRAVGGPFSLQECHPSLPQSSHASGRKGLDVALPTLLVEAEPGGSCGYRWPSPWPGPDRGWRGQRNARLWQNCLYKVQACSQSAVFVRFPIRKAPAMQRGGLLRIRFKSHLSSPFVVGSELIQKQVVSPVSERNFVV